MKKVLIVAVVLVVGWVFWHWDSSPPVIHWLEAPTTLGREGSIHLEVREEGRGLKAVEVTLTSGKGERALVQDSYSATWPWQQGLTHQDIVLSPKNWLENESVSEGLFSLRVTLSDQPNLWLWKREVAETREFRLDLTPPRISLLSGQHYIRQGGSEAITYQVSKDTISSGVRVGSHLFTGFPLPNRAEGTHICLFALAHNQSPETPMLLWAEDAAGNRSETTFWKKVTEAQFRKRRIVLTDSLLESIVPQILSHQDQVPEQEDLLKTFLRINGDLRQANDRQIEEISRQSVGRLLWDGSFMQLTGSQVNSAFADHRTYYYGGKMVDEQTHLGFDLASTAQSPVECANDGRVLFADYLGIYGNALLVDHGLGLISLYGHLSTIEVEKGQEVRRGEILGRTGQTGLAGGDHLHFSMILQGVHVNPLEWWDSQWINQHIFSKLATERP